MWSAKNVHGNLITAIFFLICWTHFSFVVADQTEVNLVEEYNALIKIRTGDLNHQEISATITEEFVQVIRQNKQRDLICTYLFHSLIHMHLTKMVLEPYKITEYTFDLIYWFSEPIQKMLSTLYEFKSFKSKTMMSFYLYINLLIPFFKSVSLNKIARKDAYKRLVKLHENLYHKMISEFLHCRGNDVVDLKTRFINIKLINKYIMENLFDLTMLIEKNHYKKSLLYSSYNEMSLNFIYLNDFGYGLGVTSIISKYDVQVNWKSLPEKIGSRWRGNQDIDLKTDRLESLISYLTLCINFLKICMLRFTWFYLEYLDKFNLKLAAATETVPPTVNDGYIPQWFDILTDFVKLLDLKKDKFFLYLLSSFGRNAVDVHDRLANLTLRNIIQLELEYLEASINVTATKQNELDVNWVEISNFQEKVKEKSINRAKSFVDDIRSLFKGVNFQIIQTIIELKN